MWYFRKKKCQTATLTHTQERIHNTQLSHDGCTRTIEPRTGLWRFFLAGKVLSDSDSDSVNYQT